MTELNNSLKLTKALDIALNYGGFDGADHKMWCIDQIVRVLAGDKYEEVIRSACDGVDGPETYEWDVGIPP